MGHQSFFETGKSPQTRMNTKKNVTDSKIGHITWLRRLDLNQRPSGYEPDELPTAPLRDIEHHFSGAHLLYHVF